MRVSFCLLVIGTMIGCGSPDGEVASQGWMASESRVDSDSGVIASASTVESTTRRADGEERSFASAAAHAARTRRPRGAGGDGVASGAFVPTPGDSCFGGARHGANVMVCNDGECCPRTCIWDCVRGDESTFTSVVLYYWSEPYCGPCLPRGGGGGGGGPDEDEPDDPPEPVDGGISPG